MGALDFAGGTVVHVNAGVAALVAAIVVGKRQRLSRRRAPAAQRAVHAARRRPALVRLVRLQRRQRARRQRHRRARVHGHDARAGRHAGRLDAARLRARGKPTAVGAATAIVVGLVAVTPAAGFVGPMSAIVLGAIAAVPSYFALVWRAQDLARRLARRRRGARRRRHGRRAADRRLRAEGAQRRRRRAAVRQSRSARHPGGGRRRGHRLQRGHELRAAEADRRWSSRCARRRATRAPVSTSRSTAKRPTCTARGSRRRHSRAASTCRWARRNHPPRHKSRGAIASLTREAASAAFRSDGQQPPPDARDRLSRRASWTQTASSPVRIR